MKNIKIIVLLLISSFTILSCSTDDKTIDELFSTIERGAILRTTNFNGTYNIFDVNDTFFQFEVGVEEQDVENGGLVSEIKLYQTFVDNTDDNVDNSKPEVLLISTPASALAIGSNGLPVFDMTMQLADALAASSLSDGEFFGGDQFIYRFELVLTDGRVFTDNVGGPSIVGGTVSGGSFFSSPFLYNVTIKCVPVVPFAGDYILNLKDSYGDGWDGAFITVTIDGVATDYDAGDASGLIHTVTVPDGTASLVFTYTAGSFEGEHSYVITGPFGVEAASDGPGPNPGTIILNICN